MNDYLQVHLSAFVPTRVPKLIAIIDILDSILPNVTSLLASLGVRTNRDPHLTLPPASLFRIEHGRSSYPSLASRRGGDDDAVSTRPVLRSSLYHSNHGQGLYSVFHELILSELPLKRVLFRRCFSDT